MRHFLDLTRARAINTAAMALTREAVGDLSAAKAMGAIHGEAGLGKTFAVECAAQALALDQVHWFEFPHRTMPKWLTVELLELLTGIEHEGEHRPLKRELVRVLAEQPRLLVVDEAQRLNRECIDHLRSLHDHRETWFALLLVGGNGCWEVLSRHPMLRSRIWRRVSFERLTPPEVVKIIPSFHPIFEGADPELIRLIDDVMGHGVFRNWAGFTKTAEELCRRHQLEGVTEEVARAVFVKHGGGLRV